MSGLEIGFLVVSTLLVIVVFLTKSKAHERDHRILTRRERERQRERDEREERRPRRRRWL